MVTNARCYLNAFLEMEAAQELHVHFRGSVLYYLGHPRGRSLFEEDSLVWPDLRHAIKQVPRIFPWRGTLDAAELDELLKNRAFLRTTPRFSPNTNFDALSESILCYVPPPEITYTQFYTHDQLEEAWGCLFPSLHIQRS